MSTALCTSQARQNVIMEIKPDNERANYAIGTVGELLWQLNETLPDAHGKFVGYQHLRRWEYVSIRYSYVLTLDNFLPRLECRIGRGTLMKKRCTDVDILTARPEMKSFGVARVHCIIKPSVDGTLLIESVSKTEPLIVYPTSGEQISLLAGESYVLQDRMKLQFGALIYETFFNKDAATVTEYAARRNSEFERRDIPVPNSLLRALPLHWETTAIGPAIAHTHLNWDMHGELQLGVLARTGEAVVIKTIKLGENLQWHDLDKVTKIYFSPKDVESIVRGQLIGCKHGPADQNDVALLAEKGGNLNPFCNDPHCTVYYILDPYQLYPFLSGYDWEKASLTTKLNVFQDLLQGAHYLHEAGFVVGDYINTLRLSPDSYPTPIITGFEEPSWRKRIDADIYKLGHILLSMLFPRTHVAYELGIMEQSTNAYEKMMRLLEEATPKGVLPIAIRDAVHGMHGRRTSTQWTIPEILDKFQEVEVEVEIDDNSSVVSSSSEESVEP